MCSKRDALRAKRAAVCTLSLVCLSPLPIELLRDESTLRLLPEAPPDLAELLARLR